MVTKETTFEMFKKKINEILLTDPILIQLFQLIHFQYLHEDKRDLIPYAGSYQAYIDNINDEFILGEWNCYIEDGCDTFDIEDIAELTYRNMLSDLTKLLITDQKFN